MMRWYKPRLASKDEDFWRCTEGARKAAHANPAAWSFIDWDLDKPPSSVNAGTPLLSIVDAPSVRAPSRAPIRKSLKASTRRLLGREVRRRPVPVARSRPVEVRAPKAPSIHDQQAAFVLACINAGNKRRNESPLTLAQLARGPEQPTQVQVTAEDFIAVAVKNGLYAKPLDLLPKAANAVEFMKQRIDARIEAEKAWRKSR
jgi:hypothetical protein